jgi:hypothetical protein
MITLIPYFGDGAARYDRLIRVLSDSWERVGAKGKHPLRLLCDREMIVPDDLGLPVVRVDDQRHADLVRLGNAGQNFDYKGSLVLALLELELGEPVCVMDADNAIHRDPSAGLEDMLHAAGRSVCLVPDPGERPIIHPWFDRPVPEESTSLAVYGADSAWLVDKYREAWAGVTDPEFFLREQRVWTLVALRHGAIYPQRWMSWSRVWGLPPPLEVMIEHRHGEAKWR